MNRNRIDGERSYLALHAPTWPDLHRQVKAVLGDCWHRHAGCWQPERISLHVASRIMRDATDTGQRELHLPLLVAWLRQQGCMVTVLGDSDLPEHRLYLKPPMHDTHIHNHAAQPPRNPQIRRN